MRTKMGLTSGPITKNIYRFALPLAATSVLQQLFNAADLSIVGHFAGTNSMAAVGTNASLIALLINLFIGISLGALTIAGVLNVLLNLFFVVLFKMTVNGVALVTVLSNLISSAIITVVGVCGVRILWISTVFRMMPAFQTIMAIYPISLFITGGAIMINQERLGVLDAAWPSTLCSSTGHACDPAGGYIVNGVWTPPTTSFLPATHKSGRGHHVHGVFILKPSRKA